MQRLTMLIYSFLITILLPHVSGWGIMFYSGENCNEDPNFNSVSYFGESTDDSWCLEAGAPGQNCKWHTNEGATSDECSVPTQPMPGSYRYSEGSYCCIQIRKEPDCSYKNCDVPGAGNCWPTKYLAYEINAPKHLTFVCSDVDGEKPGAFNVTDPGAAP